MFSTEVKYELVFGLELINAQVLVNSDYLLKRERDLCYREILILLCTRFALYNNIFHIFIQRKNRILHKGIQVFFPAFPNYFPALFISVSPKKRNAFSCLLLPYPYPAISYAPSQEKLLLNSRYNIVNNRVFL
jgi:hypothetical protein